MASTSHKEVHGSEQGHDQPSPWLVVSSDRLHTRFPIVQAIPLTSQLQKQEQYLEARIRIAGSAIVHMTVAPSTRPLAVADTLALTEQLRVLSHERLLSDPIARISKSAYYAVEAGIKHVLGMG